MYLSKRKKYEKDYPVVEVYKGWKIRDFSIHGFKYAVGKKIFEQNIFSNSIKSIYHLIDKYIKNGETQK